MNVTYQIFNQLVIMMTIAVIGFIFSKLAKVVEVEQKFLSKLLLYFINPCLIITSFNVDFDKTKFIGLCISIAVSFLVTFLFILIGEIFFRQNIPLRKIQKLGIIFTNCGFIGIPLIKGVYGTEGVFFLMGYLVAFNVLLWVYGYYQVTGKFNVIKIITNPNVLAVLIGIIIFCLPFRLPQAIAYPIELIGGTNTACSMILLGILFGALKKEWMVKLWNTFKSFFNRDAEYAARRKKIGSLLFTSFMRLCGCALFSVFFCVLIYKGIALCFPSLDTQLVILVISIVLIASLCPTGVSVSSFACLFDGDTVFTNFLVCFTHAMCVVTIPLFLNLFTKLVM